MQSWGIRPDGRATPELLPHTPMNWIRNNTLFEILTSLGLTSNLQLCLDAGDSASYSSGQSWLDRSGNGYDFFRGTTSASQATDPTFNGTAGAIRSTEYWSFDAGDFFTYDTTNETWMENLHKNNAVHTLLCWVYPGSVATNQAMAGTVGATGSGTGFGFQIDAGAALLFQARNAGVVALNVNTTATFSATAWQMGAVALDEAAATGTLQINSTQESFTSTYSSPAAGAASQTMQIGARGNAQTPLVANSRMAMFAAWSSKLTDAQLLSIYTATRGRFGV